MLDNRALAIDPKDGESIWEQRTAQIEFGYSITSAPLVANGIVITGVAGAEYVAKGLLDGWHPQNGDYSWRFNTIAKTGEKGSESWQSDEWEYGGGPTWLIGSYDKEFDLLYSRVGKKSPWNITEGAKDNLYTQSVLAIKAKAAELVWHYQFTQKDGFNYEAVNNPTLADIKIAGTHRKVMMQANSNGYFYLLDRTNGELLKANKFVDKVNGPMGLT